MEIQVQTQLSRSGVRDSFSHMFFSMKFIELITVFFKYSPHGLDLPEGRTSEPGWHMSVVISLRLDSLYY